MSPRFAASNLQQTETSKKLLCISWDRDVYLYIVHMHSKVACLYIDENLQKNLIWWGVLFTPASLQEVIIDVQSQFQIYDEIKFSKISKNKLPLYKKVIDILWRYEYAHWYIAKYSHRLTHKDYISFCSQVIDQHPDIDSRLIFVDYFDCRKGFHFEQRVVASHKKILFCLREDSKANKLLQSVDLVLWCAGQVFGVSEITSPKKQNLLQHYKKSKLSERVALFI